MLRYTTWTRLANGVDYYYDPMMEDNFKYGVVLFRHGAFEGKADIRSEDFMDLSDDTLALLIQEKADEFMYGMQIHNS